MEQNKLQNIFGDLYNELNASNHRPAFDDNRLWLLFKEKGVDVQNNMLKSGEGLKLSTLPSNSLRVETPAKETSISTPPTTPTIPVERCLDGLKLWRSLDVNEQAKLFRHQLTTAKDAQLLKFEWEEYCVDVRRKERSGEYVLSAKGQSAEPQMLRNDNTATSENSERNQLDSQAMKHFATPPPVTKENDLKSKLESRLRESALKRQRAKELAKAREEGDAKKIKL
ncbi:hypothetical protein BDZ45DRAFT_382177 [Acephala macrosclerotiorum]|nr:hypothetical protein BDZ45DRAFT_382177 [Acephala macrosclerotiorum]